MDCIFTIKQIMRAGILLYVGLWLLLALKLWGSQKYRRPEGLKDASKLFLGMCVTRWYGWLLSLAFVIVAGATLPSVHIARCENDKYTCNEYYALFKYKGHRLKPGMEYLFNDTDSTLILYSITTKENFLLEISDPWERIKPGNLTRINSKPDKCFPIMMPSFSNPYTFFPPAGKINTTDIYLDIEHEGMKMMSDMRQIIRNGKIKQKPFIDNIITSDSSLNRILETDYEQFNHEIDRIKKLQTPNNIKANTDSTSNITQRSGSDYEPEENESDSTDSK